MAGHIVYQYFSEKKEYEMFNVTFRNKYTEDSRIIDVRDEQSVKSVIQSIRPDIVINCIGILIKGTKSSLENAIFVNSYFPHMLSRLLHQVVPDARLIHISTDCVFSGKKGGYVDSDEKDALDFYGMSKNLGEIVNDKDLTIRTSIIGPEIKKSGEGLFHWIFEQKPAGSLNGYTKSIWGGVTTLELARVIDFCIQNCVTGLYQASNNQPISKYDLIKTIVEEFGLPISISSIEGVVCDKSIVNTVLGTMNYDVPSYEAMIRDVHRFMIDHKEMYTQYFGG